MIKKYSDDPNVEQAAEQALTIINELLASLPKANGFDYGGQELHIGEYDVCSECTIPIAEAQQAQRALLEKSETIDDPVIKEHLVLAAQLFEKEAEAATIRAEFHNGIGTEKILNTLLGYRYDRRIFDDYSHSHTKGA